MKHIKKTKEIFFNTFFSLYKNNKQRLSKTQRKTPKRGTGKVSKSFWRRKRQTAKKDPRKIPNFTEEEKEKNFSIIVKVTIIFLKNKKSYYTTHNKKLLGHFLDFSKIIRHIKKIMKFPYQAEKG